MRKQMQAATICALMSGIVQADPLDGEKQIWLSDGTGAERRIGTVLFTPDADGARYVLELSDEIFADHFLSMRPFKCLEGQEKHWCHVPYPYEIRRHVSAQDLTDLEYDLLFVWKGATDYGINLWNGVYYEIKVQENGLIGQMRELDMDVLSAPPAPGNLRPVQPKDLHETDPGSHWLPHLAIR